MGVMVEAVIFVHLIVLEKLVVIMAAVEAVVVVVSNSNA
jgi:hypothetical protein